MTENQAYQILVVMVVGVAASGVYLRAIGAYLRDITKELQSLRGTLWDMKRRDEDDWV